MRCLLFLFFTATRRIIAQHLHCQFADHAQRNAMFIITADLFIKFFDCYNVSSLKSTTCPFWAFAR